MLTRRRFAAGAHAAKSMETRKRAPRPRTKGGACCWRHAVRRGGVDTQFSQPLFRAACADAMPEPELDALLPDPAGGVCGYLHVRGEDFALRVLSGVAGGPATLEASPKLQAVLAGHEPLLLRRLEQTTDVSRFITELRELIHRQIPPRRLLPPPAFYELFISEIDALGWSNLETVKKSIR